MIFGSYCTNICSELVTNYLMSYSGFGAKMKRTPNAAKYSEKDCAQTG